jgi:hypothetical protein
MLAYCESKGREPGRCDRCGRLMLLPKKHKLCSTCRQKRQTGQDDSGREAEMGDGMGTGERTVSDGSYST